MTRPLDRTLGFTDLLLIVVGTVIGSGIFVVPALVLRQTGGALGPALLVWFVAGILSLLGALTYAELGASKPEAGGLYAYIRDAFGPLPAFLYGWTTFFVIGAGSVAALAVAFTSYLRQLTPVSPLAARVVAVLMIVIIAAISVRGTRQGASMQNHRRPRVLPVAPHRRTPLMPLRGAAYAPPHRPPATASSPRMPITSSRLIATALLFSGGIACAAGPAPTPAVTPQPAASPAPAAAPDSRFAYDVVIRNGRVLDGAGNPWILADVGIRDGRFATIGVVRGTGRTEIDARGKYVSPGWIDMMDQSGGVLPVNGLAENKLRQGITTAIGGEGGTPVPASRVAEYFAGLERSGISINFGSYFSEAQARSAVLGPAARAPTAAELERMRAIMDTAMRGGAMGMTTALIYPPGSYASTDELVEVAKVAARHGGTYASHIRGEGKEVVQSVRELIEIAERAGLPGEIFHLKVAHRPSWGVLMDSVRMVVDAARARGVDVAADIYVYTAGGTGLESTIPSWAFEGGRDSLRARLADPAVRARLKRELVTGSPGWWNIVEAAGGWDGIVLANARNPGNEKYVGMRISDIAKAQGKAPEDAAWDLVLQGQGRVMAIFHMMSEPDIETALRFPWTSIGTDAGAVVRVGAPDQTGLPHPRSFGNAVRVISRYVKERRVLTLEDAVRKMTSWPATRMRLAERGVIREGQWADVTIFDLDALDDRASYERPMDFPAGIEWVLVNGVVVIERGQHTGAKPGKVLWGPGTERRAGAGPATP